MSQMKAADLAVVKSLPGNDKCVDCGLKQPQWASVSFGTVFCLECSGVHRSLGVHISFVRSIAMDSWTPDQIALMKAGGNAKCNAYLTSKGINPSTPIRQKYDSGPASLYKEVLKARVQGKPEPTSLPAATPKKKTPYNPMSNSSHTKKVEDQNGMERLSNESEADYVKRQMRLRDEAKARMAAKFGNGNRSMGGVGSTPAPSGFETPFSIEDVAGTLSSGISTATSGLNSAWSSAKSSGVAESMAGAGLGLWSSISQSAQGVAEQLANTDISGVGTGIGFVGSGGGGLTALSQKIKSEKKSSGRSYSGFGSEDMQLKNSLNINNHNSEVSNVTATAHEDPNGIAPLTGETDQQYMERQIRIREEATKRMEAKFGKKLNLSTVSSSEGKSEKTDVASMKAKTNDDFFSSFGA